MGNKSPETGPRSPEYTPSEYAPEHAKEFTKDSLTEYTEKLKKILEVTNDLQTKATEEKTGAVIEKIQREGINMETMREMLQVLEKTNFEAFSSAEIQDLIVLIDFIVLEVDTTYKQFYQDLKQRLIGIAQIKEGYERTQSRQESQKQGKNNEDDKQY